MCGLHAEGEAGDPLLVSGLFGDVVRVATPGRMGAWGCGTVQFFLRCSQEGQLHFDVHVDEEVMLDGSASASMENRAFGRTGQGREDLGCLQVLKPTGGERMSTLHCS